MGREIGKHKNFRQHNRSSNLCCFFVNNYMIVQMCFEQERINAAILLLITRSRAAEVGVHFTFQNVRNMLAF